MDDATNPFANVPIEITISVGRTRAPIRELLRLGPDTVLPLDRQVDDLVELQVGGKVIARGELTELPAGRLAVRLTEVADLKAGL